MSSNANPFSGNGSLKRFSNSAGVASGVTLRVASDATKTTIRSAIEQLFGVKVTGVWTSNQRGKARRVGQQLGRRPHWKKAVVKLRDGDTIDIFEG